MKSFTPTEASYNLGGGAEKSLTFLFYEKKNVSAYFTYQTNLITIKSYDTPKSVASIPFRLLLNTEGPLPCHEEFLLQLRQATT